MASPPPDLSAFVARRNSPGGEGTPADLTPGVPEGTPDLTSFLPAPTPGGSEGQPLPAHDLSEFLPGPGGSRPTDSNADEFARGLLQGTDQTQQMFWGLANMVGRELNIGWLQERSERGIAQNQAEMEAIRPSIMSVSEIESMDDFFAWAAGGLGRLSPNLGTSVAAGGIGGIIGRKGVEATIRDTVKKQIAKELTLKGIGEDAAEATAERALRSEAGLDMLKRGFSTAGAGQSNAILATQGFTRGAQVGFLGSSTAMNTAEIDLALRERGIESTGTALLGGAAAGFLDALPFTRLLGNLFPGTPTTVSKAFVRDFAKATGTQAVLEGTTEGAQEVIQLAALAFHDPTFDLLDPTNGQQVLDAFALGALMGGVTGGGTFAAGQAIQPGQAPAAPPPAPPPAPRIEPEVVPPTTPQEVFPDGFQPADNTLFQEIRSRVDAVVAQQIEPAINTIRESFQDGVNQTMSIFPAAAARIEQLAAPVRQAHREFVEGHRPILEDTKRFATEQIRWIYEQAEQLPRGQRAQWVQNQLDDVRAQVSEVAQVLGDRANAIVQNLETRADQIRASQQGLVPAELDSDTGRVRTPSDQMAESQIGDAAEIESQFVFGKSGTRGENVQGFKNRSGSKSSARGLLEDLRRRFPSASDSTFVIREQADGTFVVALADSGQMAALREDEIVSNALEAARRATRGNPARAKTAAKLKNADGTETLIDVDTLVFEGRKLGDGDNQTTEQAFAAMAGSLFSRGLIDGNQLQTLTENFQERFPALARRKPLPKARTQQGQEERARERREREINQRMEALPRPTRDAINEAVDARMTREAAQRPPPDNADTQTIEQATKRGAFAGADRKKRRLDLLEAALESIDVRAEREGRRIAGDPSAISDPQEVPQEIGQGLESLAGETDRNDGAPAPTRGSTAKPRPKPRQSTIAERSKARKSTKGTGALTSKNRAVVYMPGTPKRIREAMLELTNRVIALVNPNTDVRVIDKQARDQMLNEGHPDASIVMHSLDFDGASILYQPASPTNGNRAKAYILMLGEDTQTDMGSASSGLLHELGHLLHYDTWANLSEGDQTALLEAFAKDVDSGRRQTGEAMESTMATDPRTSKMWSLMTKADQQNILRAEKNMFEFREWMADQFVDWMATRTKPRNAVQRFFEAVGKKIDELWNFMNSNPGRYNQLNETYAEFVDSIAKRVARGDPTLFEATSSSETARGRPLAFLFPSGDQKAPGYFASEHFRIIQPPGLSVPAWRQLADRWAVQYPRIAENARSMVNMMESFYAVAIAPSTSGMRTLAKRVPAARKLVTKFNRAEMGAAKKTKNYHQRMKLMKGQFMNKFDKITAGLSEESMTLMAQNLRAHQKDPSVRLTPRERQLRKLFDEFHEYLVESGLPVGKIERYFPGNFDRQKLLDGQQRIISWLVRNNNMTEGRATAFFNSLISNEAETAAALEEVQADELSMQSPSFRNMRSRTAKAPFWDQFRDDNLQSVVSNYIISGVKRAEYNNFLGGRAPRGQALGRRLPRTVWNPQQQLDDILFQARQEGASREDLIKMKNYVDANLGMYGRDDVSDRLRTAMATMIAYQNMRTLLFTVFASLPDMVGPMIRTGSMRQGFTSFIKNVREGVKSGSDLDEVARAWGIVSSAANQHVLTEYVDNHYMPAGIRKWNDRFFQYTGLNWYTDFTRKIALATGIDYIKQQNRIARDDFAQPSARRKARNALKELGLKPEQVQQWILDGQRTWGGVGYDNNSRADQAVAEAMVQFVDESVLSPNPSQRPILASHPGFMLVYHLKGFIYAMQDTILRRMAHNFKVAEGPAQTMAAVAPAILMLALTAIGLELRELITRRKYTDRMDGWDYTWELVDRSGLLGIAQLGYDFTDAGSAYGRSELAGLLGPSVSQAGDLISRPLSQTIPKGTPVVSQLPWARNLMRDITPI